MDERIRKRKEGKEGKVGGLKKEEEINELPIFASTVLK